MRTIRAVLSVLAFAGLTACATAPADGTMSRVNEPVAPELTVLEEDARIPFPQRVRGFRLTADERAVLLEAPGRSWFLVEVSPSCERDLRFAQAIGIDSGLGGSLDKFGRLLIEGRRCQIQRIARVEDPRDTAAFEDQAAQD